MFFWTSCPCAKPLMGIKSSSVRYMPDDRAECRRSGKHIRDLRSHPERDTGCFGFVRGVKGALFRLLGQKNVLFHLGEDPPRGPGALHGDPFFLATGPGGRFLLRSSSGAFRRACTSSLAGSASGKTAGSSLFIRAGISLRVTHFR